MQKSKAKTPGTSGPFRDYACKTCGVHPAFDDFKPYADAAEFQAGEVITGNPAGEEIQLMVVAGAEHEAVAGLRISFGRVEYRLKTTKG